MSGLSTIPNHPSALLDGNSILYSMTSKQKATKKALLMSQDNVRYKWNPHLVLFEKEDRLNLSEVDRKELLHVLGKIENNFWVKRYHESHETHGMCLVIVGILMTLTAILAIIGIPCIIFGVYVWCKGGLHQWLFKKMVTFLEFYSAESKNCLKKQGFNFYLDFARSKLLFNISRRVQAWFEVVSYGGHIESIVCCGDAGTCYR